MSTTRPAIYPVLGLRDRAQAVVGHIASGPLADALADLLCQDEITPDRLAEVLIDVHDEITGTPQPKPHVWHKGERGELYSRTNNTWRSGTVIVAGSVTVPTEFQFDDNGSVARLYDLSVLRPLSEVLADSEQVTTPDDVDAAALDDADRLPTTEPGDDSPRSTTVDEVARIVSDGHGMDYDEALTLVTTYAAQLGVDGTREGEQAPNAHMTGGQADFILTACHDGAQLDRD